MTTQHPTDTLTGPRRSFETRAIHDGQEPDPADRRDHRADLPDQHLRPGGHQPEQGLRLRPHRQPDPHGAADRHRLAGGRRLGSGLRQRHGRHAERSCYLLCARRPHPALRRLLRRHVPAGEQDPGALRRRVLDGRPRPTSTRCAAACADNTKLVWVETPTNPLPEDRRHRRRRADRARGRARCWSSTTPSRRRTCSSRWRWAPTWSSTRPPSTWAGTRTSSAAPSSADDPELYETLKFHPERGRRRAGAVRLLAGAARPQDAGRAHGASTRANAQRIAEWLQRDPAVERVFYPGLPVAPEPRGRRAPDARLRRHGLVHDARRLREAPSACVGATKIFTLAESLGGVESLIEHPGEMTHASVAGSAAEVAAEPGAPLRRHRAHRRPAGRPGAGAGGGRAGGGAVARYGM